jgi:two-component system LytT family response regulator
MQKAIIIDDEELARITLQSFLENFVDDVEVVASCSNVPEGVMAINKLNPDIVFLDIEMPQYNGFELPAFFKEINFEIIFVTAYSQYAIRAFEVSAIDYLLKPVEIESLKKAVEKAKLKRNQSNIIQRLDIMQKNYQGEDVRKIALPMSDGLLFVELDEIIYFEADRSYTDVFFANGSKITVTKPMRTFEEILEKRMNFFRPHRSFLININYLQKYQKGDSLLIMNNKAVIGISRERKQEFESRLKDLGLSL